MSELRDAIARADAVLFATPEYNSSVPGQLKNAIDWASRPRGAAVLLGKPVAVIGASTGSFGGVWAQAELKKILRTAGAGWSTARSQSRGRTFASRRTDGCSTRSSRSGSPRGRRARRAGAAGSSRGLETRKLCEVAACRARRLLALGLRRARGAGRAGSTRGRRSSRSIPIPSIAHSPCSQNEHQPRGHSSSFPITPLSVQSFSMAVAWNVSRARPSVRSRIAPAVFPQRGAAARRTQSRAARGSRHSPDTTCRSRRSRRPGSRSGRRRRQGPQSTIAAPIAAASTRAESAVTKTARYAASPSTATGCRPPSRTSSAARLATARRAASCVSVYRA